MMNQLRRTMLFVPGNNPGMLRDAGIYPSDCIIFDLEDSVSLNEKDGARFLVHEALSRLSYNDKELFVRVNPLESEFGREDLEAVVSTGKAAVRLPKTENAQDILDCEREIERIEKVRGIEVGKTKMMAAVETAEGVLNAREIAKASKRIVAISIGAEDFVADLKTTRSKAGTELFFARNMILLAARSAGISAIDTVFSDVNDEVGLREEVALIKQLGFDGKSIINPRQVYPVHEIFAPTPSEIEKAIAIIEAIEEAEKRGSGVVALNGKMIDKPVADRARRTIDIAMAIGVIQKKDQDSAYQEVLE